ncbi:hypothetical protein WN944_001586 [Citrus x changshan-huyou]|uniref:Uncharacterized protein n=1 Tax=Citrus x changshan-huyou TaxID=2935761 RepID=A0AAP0MJN2_9ROSI
MDLTMYFLYKLWLGVDSTLGAGAYILVGTPFAMLSLQVVGHLLGVPIIIHTYVLDKEIPGLDIIVDPCAAIIVLFVTGLLCVGIKESSIDSVSLQFSQSSLAISGENLVDVGTLK